MKTTSIEADTPSGQDRGHPIHPILGNYHLPVEIENARKQSGVHNLSREGWGEDKCRNYLIRLCSDVPRNFPYTDGLRILHPRLQARFGDENVDLALGVLEELIEVEELPPFAPSVFQRWKHEHLRRKASSCKRSCSPSLSNSSAGRLHKPPCPPYNHHTSASRAHQSTYSIQGRGRARKKLVEPQISPSCIPYCESCNSKIAHQPSWKIEHSVFVSVGGKPPTLAYCPTPAELHKGMWDPEYGRGGARARPDTAQSSLPETAIEPTEPHATSSKYSTPTRSFMNNAKRELSHRVMSALSETREDPTNVPSEARMELIDVENYGGILNDRVSAKSKAAQTVGDQNKTRKVSAIKNVALPPGREIPNANFARKNELIPGGQPTPDYLLGLRQPTFDDVVDKLYESKDNKSARCPELNPLRFYLSKYHSVPASPSDFFDGGLDYKWAPSEVIESTESDISSTYSASGIDEVLRLTHLTYEDSYNITDNHQVENMHHTHTTDCFEQLESGRFSISESHTTGIFEDQEEEILYPTVYVRPTENISNKKSSVENLMKDAHEHQGRNSYDGTCKSWECRYRHEYRKSVGDIVKWNEPSSGYSELEESEISEVSHLSPTVYSPPSSLDPLNKYKGFPRMAQQTRREGSSSSENFEVTVPQLFKPQFSNSPGKVNITPPARLFERSYISNFPLRVESSAAFGVAGSQQNSILATTEHRLSLKPPMNSAQHTLTNEHLTI
ncbi:hypothetical protein EYC80_009573 [Monilinia laxa]|uniref:Uncharacterized protein n=1 Tax=Monilinia laxa TaxID=61186 RepID=A0A5N6JYJ8_MONLA|nr:hypothetical protein EYC80_009573 [Monilinia laxa]